MIEVTPLFVIVFAFIIIGILTTTIGVINAIIWFVEIGNAIIYKYKNNKK